MFLNLPAKNYRNQWVTYNLKNEKGELIHFDIVKLTELTMLDGIKNLDQHELIFLTVVDVHEDKLVLANRLSAMANAQDPKMQQHILKIRQKLTRKDHGNAKRVMCVDTGETFQSAKECAQQHSLTYIQLLNHLNGMPSYNSVKKKRYKWI